MPCGWSRFGSTLFRWHNCISGSAAVTDGARSTTPNAPTAASGSIWRDAAGRNRNAANVAADTAVAAVTARAAIAAAAAAADAAVAAAVADDDAVRQMSVGVY